MASNAGTGAPIAHSVLLVRLSAFLYSGALRSVIEISFSHLRLIGSPSIRFHNNRTSGADAARLP
jgi:hypothetical protein